jgi:hypothetical protein
VLVQAEQGVAAEQVHGVVEIGVGVLVQHRLLSLGRADASAWGDYRPRPAGPTSGG